MAKTKLKGVWKVHDVPELGNTYRDVFHSGKIFKCIKIVPVRDIGLTFEYTMENVKTGERATYQEEGWKLVKAPIV